jgi:hypothetical protein
MRCPLSRVVSRVLSVVIESGAYEQKLTLGPTRKLASVWLCWRLEPPLDVSMLMSTPRSPAKKGVKKEKRVRPEPSSKLPLEGNGTPRSGE